MRTVLDEPLIHKLLLEPPPTLVGEVALPAAPPVGTGLDARASEADVEGYSVKTWSEKLPTGFAAAQERSMMAYDAHMLEFARQLSHLQHNYASGLRDLLSREAKARNGGEGYSSGEEAHGVPYASAGVAWDELIAVLRAHEQEVQASGTALCETVVAPCK